MLNLEGMSVDDVSMYFRQTYLPYLKDRRDGILYPYYVDNVYVDDATQKVMLTGYFVDNNFERHKRRMFITSKRIINTRPEAGYYLENDGRVMYISRIPSRQYKRGLHRNQYDLRQSHGSNEAFQRFLLAGLNPEKQEKAKLGDLRYSQIISREFATKPYANNQHAAQLMYRDNVVGIVKDDGSAHLLHQAAILKDSLTKLGLEVSLCQN